MIDFLLDASAERKSQWQPGLPLTFIKTKEFRSAKTLQNGTALAVN
jgi:hypothetical protein